MSASYMLRFVMMATYLARLGSWRLLAYLDG